MFTPNAFHAHRAPVPEDEPLPGEAPIPEEDPVPDPAPVIGEPPVTESVFIE